MFLLRALHEAGVKGALVGVIFDPALAAEAHGYGLHYNFDAQVNRDETTEFSEQWSAPARVVALTDGDCVGRRGIYAGQSLHLAPAPLRIGGITVVVISHQVKCADPIFFEMMGLDIGKARAVVVKSRGHFRGGFDEFFDHERIIEVDLPGPVTLAGAGQFRMEPAAAPGDPARRGGRLASSRRARHNGGDANKTARRKR